MSPKEIIESGILEEYVMGTLPEKESIEITRMCLEHPAIAAEVQAIEAALMQSFSAPVKPEWKKDILSSLESTTVNITDINQNNGSGNTDGKIIPITSNKSQKWFWAAASFAGLFIISAAANFMLLNKNQTLAQELTDTQVKLMNETEEKGIFAAKYDKVEMDYQYLFDPNLKRIEMKGTPAFTNLSCMLYWNPTTGEVICSGVSYLPELNSQQDYQLWAIVDGKPQSAGMLTMGGPTRMSDAFSAQAFAVTIEPEGGSESPTLEKMVVVGAVESKII